MNQNTSLCVPLWLRCLGVGLVLNGLLHGQLRLILFLMVCLAITYLETGVVASVMLFFLFPAAWFFAKLFLCEKQTRYLSVLILMVPTLPAFSLVLTVLVPNPITLWFYQAQFWLVMFAIIWIAWALYPEAILSQLRQWRHNGVLAYLRWRIRLRGLVILPAQDHALAKRALR